MIQENVQGKNKINNNLKQYHFQSPNKQVKSMHHLKAHSKTKSEIPSQNIMQNDFKISSPKLKQDDDRTIKKQNQNRISISLQQEEPAILTSQQSQILEQQQIQKKLDKYKDKQLSQTEQNSSISQIASEKTFFNPFYQISVSKYNDSQKVMLKQSKTENMQSDYNNSSPIQTDPSLQLKDTPKISKYNSNDSNQLINNQSQNGVKPKFISFKQSSFKGIDNKNQNTQKINIDPVDKKKQKISSKNTSLKNSCYTARNSNNNSLVNSPFHRSRSGQKNFYGSDLISSFSSQERLNSTVKKSPNFNNNDQNFQQTTSKKSKFQACSPQAQNKLAEQFIKNQISIQRLSSPKNNIESILKKNPYKQPKQIPQAVIFLNPQQKSSNLSLKLKNRSQSSSSSTQISLKQNQKSDKIEKEQNSFYSTERSPSRLSAYSNNSKSLKNSLILKKKSNSQKQKKMENKQNSQLNQSSISKATSSILKNTNRANIYLYDNQDTCVDASFTSEKSFKNYHMESIALSMESSPNNSNYKKFENPQFFDQYVSSQNQDLGAYYFNEKDQIGQGNLSTVYKGYRKKDGKEVAIKKLDSEKINNSKMQQYLKNEIEVMKLIDSKNVVKFYGSVSKKNHQYIVTEICKQDLREYLDQYPYQRIPEDQAIGIISQVINGFKEIIQNECIHRELKPENILISENNTFKIADFGVAKNVNISSDLTMNESVGSSLYLSPQVIQNQDYTSKSDVWSLGLMLYQMIFGKIPWPSRDIKSLLYNIQNYPLQFHVDIPISQVTKNFIESCLQIEEKNRISWEQISVHPLFQKKISKNTQKIQFNGKAKSTLFQIQIYLKNKKMDVSTFLQKFKFLSENLNLEQFYKINVELGIGHTFYEIQQVFEQIFVNFASQNEYSYKKDKKTIKMSVFKNLINFYDFRDIKDQGALLISEIQEVICHNQINVDYLFTMYDLDQSGTLTLGEFKVFLNGFLPGLTDKELNLCFDALDKYKSEEIKNMELASTLAKNLKAFKTDSNHKQIKAKKLQQKIQEYLKLSQNYQLKCDSLRQLENCPIYNFPQFQKLIRNIDPNLPVLDIQVLFEYLDDEKKGTIRNQIIQIYLIR